MASKKLYPSINYTARDFNSIKEELVSYAQRYYPNTFQDFNEAGFGALMLDTVSYIGDILSYYVDYSANETFLDTAIEYENVLKLGRQMGFRFSANYASSGLATFYIIVPASITGLGPDTRYVPILKRGTAIAADSGALFMLNEDVVFGDPVNEIVVSAANEETGVPTFFAIKASAQVISGEIKEEDINIGDFEKFKSIELDEDNITEVIECFDSEGHQYYQVDYLSQDVVFVKLTNRDTATNSQARSVLKPVVVPRRFVTERRRAKTILQFGFGSERDIVQNPLIDPAITVLDVYGRDYVKDSAFDPTNLLGTDKMGISPANTNLRVVYRVNVDADVNVGSEGLSEILDADFEFDNLNELDLTTVAGVESSLEVSNDDAILGDIALPTMQELKIKIGDTFASQNRAVTAQDYQAIIYRMPPEFGGITRAQIVKDLDANKRNLNIYVIAEDERTDLTIANNTVKANLKEWLNSYRMINDTIDILDAKIANFGIEYVIVADLEGDKSTVINGANRALRLAYAQKLDIGEPIVITDIYQILNSVPDVVDTTTVRIFLKSGGQYANSDFDIDAALSPDGRYINVPDNVILELKFPSVDIIGTVV